MTSSAPSRYAIVASTLALALALGGGAAYAAAKITGHDIRNGTVTGQDIKNASLGRPDLARALRSQLAGPSAFSTYHRTPLGLSDGSQTSVARLSVPAGSYLVSFSVLQQSSSNIDGDSVVTCALTARGATIGDSVAVLQQQTGAPHFEASSLSLTVATTMRKPGLLDVHCQSPSIAAIVAHRTLVAVKLGKVDQ